MTPQIYIIIVTYNAMKWADRCFSSLRKSSVPVKTIVVDNGSTDGTQEYIKNHFPEVELIQSLENLGFGRANNIGIEKAYKAGADFFYLMNQDAWVFENSVAELLKVYYSYPNKSNIGILSPMHLDGSEKLLDRHFENYLSRNAKENRMISDLFLGNTKELYEIEFVNAAHWFLPKETVEKVGGFNPYFFHGAEDYDFVNRMSFHGLKCAICPNSKVVHDAKKQDAQINQDKAYKKKWESLRMQKETQFMDPRYPFSISKERKKLRKDLLKFMFKGYKREITAQRVMMNYLNPRLEDIAEHRKQILEAPHPFLKLND